MIPELIHPLILALLLAFGICLGFAAWTDYKKGILLPNWKYWLFPAIFLGLTIICRIILGGASAADYIVPAVLLLAYYATAYRGIMGGADFFALSLSSAILSVALGWPSLLLFLGLSLVALPLLIRYSTILGQLRRSGKRICLENLLALDRTTKKTYRLIPVILIGYLIVLIAWIVGVL